MTDRTAPNTTPAQAAPSAPTANSHSASDSPQFINKVQITGHLGRYPELRYTPNGKPVISFSIAHTERWNDANDVKRQRTHWFTVVAYGDKAEQWASDLNTGDYVRIDGALSYREWEQEDGRKRSVVEIKAWDLEILRKKQAK
ncbi:MAG: single-stranded DNA-binding protein [Nitrospirae bacterium]|nr:MAG: single-stranded DNA-binding protein [Nitrospirota bacterium]